MSTKLTVNGHSIEGWRAGILVYCVVIAVVAGGFSAGWTLTNMALKALGAT